MDKRRTYFCQHNSTEQARNVSTRLTTIKSKKRKHFQSTPIKINRFHLHLRCMCTYIYVYGITTDIYYSYQASNKKTCVCT